MRRIGSVLPALLSSRVLARCRAPDGILSSQWTVLVDSRPASALRKGLLKASRADGVIGAAMENIDAAISLRRNKILRLW
jgi:hypothetical protein